MARIEQAHPGAASVRETWLVHAIPFVILTMDQHRT